MQRNIFSNPSETFQTDPHRTFISPSLSIPERRHFQTVDGLNHRHIICAFKWLHLLEVILVFHYAPRPIYTNKQGVSKNESNHRLLGKPKQTTRKRCRTV